MRIRLFPTPQAAARSLARRIARALAANPRLVLGLPTGRTPVPLYRELVALHQAGRADFSRATTFNLDEFVGVRGDDTRSYRAFMQGHLFGGINLRAGRINFLNGAALDAGAECARYERAIARAGGIDLLILGLGANGHIGFNEPADALVAATHRVALSSATRRANAALFRAEQARPLRIGRIPDIGRMPAVVPRHALSMGMATILHARRIVLIATGRAKARCVDRMIHGPLTPWLPASFLQLHRDVEIWLDHAAASRL